MVVVCASTAASPGWTTVEEATGFGLMAARPGFDIDGMMMGLGILINNGCVLALLNHPFANRGGL